MPHDRCAVAQALIEHRITLSAGSVALPDKSERAGYILGLTARTRTIDKALKDNAIFCQSFHAGGLDAPPARSLMVITCMDARINVEAALGLKPGEAHIIRNAGGSVTDDVLRSAIISTNLMGTKQIMVINHTNCGMMTCTEEDLQKNFTKQYGPAEHGPDQFHTIDDLNQHAHEQVAKLKDHPWIPSDTVIHGFTYDVDTGRLHEIEGA